MLPNLDLDLLKTFLAIADTGNFTRAAEDVNKTQSAVSMQMKRLEELLGRPIFVREGRQSRLTADGERLIDHARRIVAVHDETVALFTKPDLTGRVRLGTPDDYADRFLPEILGRFARTHPLVELEVDCLSSRVLEERVKRSEIDVAFVTSCEAMSDEIVRREPLVWVSSARHSVHLLDEIPLASPQHGCAWRDMVIGGLARAGRRYRVAFTSNNSNAIHAAVVAGLVVGAIPEICLKPGLRVLDQRDGFPDLGRFDIGVLRKPGKPSPAAAALAHHVAESLAQYGRPAMAAE